MLLVLLLFYFIIQPFYFNFSPTTGDEPSYEPKKWNSNPNIKNSHNCYTYMLDDINPYGQKICNTYGVENCKSISKVFNKGIPLIGSLPIKKFRVILIKETRAKSW